MSLFPVVFCGQSGVQVSRATARELLLLLYRELWLGTTDSKEVLVNGALYEKGFFPSFSKYHLLKEVKVIKSNFKVVIRRESYWKGWSHYVHILLVSSKCNFFSLPAFLESHGLLPWQKYVAWFCAIFGSWFFFFTSTGMPLISLKDWKVFWLSCVKVIKPCFYLCSFLVKQIFFFNCDIVVIDIGKCFEFD